jgi:hypothetical protein
MTPLPSPSIGIGQHLRLYADETHAIGQGAEQTQSAPHPQPTDTPEIFYAFLIAGTGIPAILRFTEPRKFQLVK